MPLLKYLYIEPLLSKIENINYANINWGNCVEKCGLAARLLKRMGVYKFKINNVNSRIKFVYLNNGCGLRQENLRKD